MMEFGEIYGKVQNIMQMNQAEALKLYDCAKRFPENAIIVEIGTFKGGSAAIMAAAFLGKVYTIDIDPQVAVIEGVDNIEFIKGESSEIAGTWDKEIDMLFIDGSHFYADVRKDIANWVPKMKSGGIVCFHDYGSHPDVTLAVNETLLTRVGFPNHSLLAIIK
jgi:predicted O-methyltransferase YrrM